MIVIDINLMDGGHPIPIAVSNYVDASRINTFMREVKKLFDEVNEDNDPRAMGWVDSRGLP